MSFSLNVMYEVNIKSLDLVFEDRTSFYPESLHNGRASYVVFEELCRELTGLQKGSGNDHIDEAGRSYEQKSYEDKELFPRKKGVLSLGASSTFGANNNGKAVKKLIDAGDYKGALEFCKKVKNGYDGIDFFVFTNTGGFNVKIPFRFFVLEKETVMSHLDSKDPRKASRDSLLSVLKPKIVQFPWD